MTSYHGSAALRSATLRPNSSTGIEVVVRFLAVLELFKQGLVELEQGAAFGDITVVWMADDRVSADEIKIDIYEG